IGSAPLMTWRSEWHTPLAVMCTIASRGPGSAGATSSTDIGPFCSVKIAARIGLSYQWIGAPTLPHGMLVPTSADGHAVHRHARGRHAFECDDSAGNPLGDEERAQVRAAEAAVGDEAFAGKVEAVDLHAVGLEDAYRVVARAARVDAAVDVEAQSVAGVVAE